MLALETARSNQEQAASCIALAHERVGAQELVLLRSIAQMPERDDWEDWGARDFAHWLSMTLGISYWKASRMMCAARALEDLPLIARALQEGRLSLDKVLELCRFASPSEETELIAWAQTRAPGAIRHRGDVEVRRAEDEVSRQEQTRSVHWWYAEGRFRLEADLPAAQGATVVKALDRMASSIPVMPDEQDRSYVHERRADALVALCSAQIASDADPDRASVIVHARLETLDANAGGCEIENGPAIDPRTLRRLLCDARVQTVVEDPQGNVVSLSPMRREPPAWMVRQIRHRDRTCRFPGCEARRFTQAHHLTFWSHGGKTELANLLLICSFHHRLVHEHGWRVTRTGEGTVRWFDRGGSEYRARPGPT